MTIFGANYIRNLARPLWLSRERNRVDVVIGNPPWLAYRHMTQEMQVSFRAMSEQRGLWAGAEIATHQDLAALFVVRACELYLRKGGRFGLVLPNAALDRDHYAGFRKGHYGGKAGELALAFDPSWDLRRLRPHFFPRAACVVFGSRVELAGEASKAGDTMWAGREMPDEIEIWTGRLKAPNASWNEASTWVKRENGAVRRTGLLTKSPYAPSFTQGAIFAPRMAFVVERQEASALGLPAGRVAIRSSRSVQEKKPWKALPSIEGVIESEFLRPFYTGDNIFPFRASDPLLCVVPCGKSGILGAGQIELNSGLQHWWEKADTLWMENRSSERLTLLQQLDYQSKLSKQFPVPGLRIVYNTSGMHIVSAKIADRRALIASGLYWASVRTTDEADYLCAILNAPVTTDLVRPLMSYSKDERHIHKHVWEVPIPSFDPTNATHQRLCSLARKTEEFVRSFPLDAGLHFAASRRHIREAIASTKDGQEINEIAFELIG